MAFTIVSRHIQKLGRYSKEFIKIVEDDLDANTYELDSRLNVPLYGTVHFNLDQGGSPMSAVAFVGTVAAGTQNKVYYSNRGAAAGTYVIELTGY